MFSTTELYQTLKLPFLIEHFIEHKEQNKNLTLWKFLCMHYTPETVNDGDYEKDMKLPFKTHFHMNYANFTADLPTQNLTFPVLSPFIEAKIVNGYQPTFLTSSYLSSIWQPPKFC